ncbi:MAG TPA: POTRA domain-containing protein [Flavisolibacter sp.]
MRFIVRYSVLCTLTVLSLNLPAQVGAPENAIIFSTDGSAGPADDNRQFVIREISINGNDKTRPATILREIPFEIDHEYSLSTIAEQFYEAKRHLMNTGLFRNVVVSLRSLQGYDVYIQIDVQERWYIYPLPFVRPIDNSFFTWATQKDRDLERLNYGVRITHKNFTGRNDRLYVYLMNGYTKKVELHYNNLYLDRDLKWYTSFNMQYGKNREVNYMTMENKLMPLKATDRYLQTFFRSYVTLNYRKAIKTRHTLGIGFESEKVADSVLALNSEYATGRSSVKYAQAFYKVSYADLDFIPYPTKGYAGEVTLAKKGFNSNTIDMWQLVAKTTAYWPVGDKNFVNLRLVGSMKLPFEQPYIAQQFIGYDGMLMQGYEKFIIDGVAGGYMKASIARPIFSTVLRVPAHKVNYKLQRFNTIPLQVFAKGFVNAGYIYNTNPQTSLLNNRMLYSGGFGIDIVTFTDFVVKLEWSFNQLGQNGLYLHPRNNY